MTTATTEKKLTCRGYQARDKEGLLRLWKDESGWGEITPQQFDEWHCNTPYGDCLIVVAAGEDDEILGQLVFAPSRMVVEGSVIRSLRGAAPILHASLRGGNLKSPQHPAMLLIKKGFELAADQGFQLVYSFPAHGWLALFKLFPQFMPNPTETAEYDCFALSLQTHMQPDQRYSTAPFSSFTAEHETLWAEAVKSLPVDCAVHREHEWLNHVAGTHLKLETRSVADGRLLGYISLKKDGLITDLVARSESDLRRLLQGCLRYLQTATESGQLPFAELKGMLTKTTVAALGELPFTKVDFRFAFVSYLLDTTLDFASLRACRWYMTPLA